MGRALYRLVGDVAGIQIWENEDRRTPCNLTARRLLRLGKVGVQRPPADMIDMQMRAHDEIDVTDAEARGGERPHEVLVALEIPFRSRRPHLVVADATVMTRRMPKNVRASEADGQEDSSQPRAKGLNP